MRDVQHEAARRVCFLRIDSIARAKMYGVGMVDDDPMLRSQAHPECRPNLETWIARAKLIRLSLQRPTPHHADLEAFSVSTHGPRTADLLASLLWEFGPASSAQSNIHHGVPR
jgi:hypothetical protein